MKFAKRSILLSLLFHCCAIYGQKVNFKLTVLLFDNQNPNFVLSIDTLVKHKDINISTIPIDLFYASENFHLPYYVPSGGIMKNTTKNKECNMNKYPADVKCYRYDKRNRVINMTVNGSGITDNFNYKYNDKSQIFEIKDSHNSLYQLIYNSNGTLAELKYSSNPIEKNSYLFISEKAVD